MEELPYWRVVMGRKQCEPRWEAFASTHSAAIQAVRAAICERGPLGTRDISGSLVREGSFRSGKDTGQALYYLWLGGELMTHSRRNALGLVKRKEPPEKPTNPIIKSLGE